MNKSVLIIIATLLSSSLSWAVTFESKDDPANSNGQSSQTTAVTASPDGEAYLNAEGYTVRGADCPCHGWYGDRDADTNPSSSGGSGTQSGKTTK